MSRKRKTQKKANNKKPSFGLLKRFCVLFIVIFSGFVGYWWHSYSELRQAQEQILCSHNKHIAKVDSLYIEMKSMLWVNNNQIENDVLCLIDSLSSVPYKRQQQINIAMYDALQKLLIRDRNSDFYLQLQRDSVLCQYEQYIAQNQIKSMLSLHLDKIDNDYAKLGLWGAVLSIIFIAFGFFAIFKIEETKLQAYDVLKDVESRCTSAMKDIASKKDQLTTMFSTMNEQYNMLYEQYKSRLEILSEDNHINSKNNNVEE